MKKELFIVDDDPIFRMIVSMTMKTLDATLTIHECEDGEIGLTQLSSLHDAQTPVVVLLDINMPVLNGWGFLDKLALNHFYKLTKLNIYIVSSSTDESDMLKAKQYDFVKGFYHKPLLRQDMELILNSF